MTMINILIYCNTMSALIVFPDKPKLETKYEKWRLLVTSQNHLIINWNSIHHCTFQLLLYHRSCSSLDFFGIVIVNVCFFPGADFLLNRALHSRKKLFVKFWGSLTFVFSTACEVQETTYLWMESMSGTGPFLSFPTGKSILGKAIVAPPVAATALRA